MNCLEQIQADTSIFSYKLNGDGLHGLDVSFADEMAINESAMSVDILFADGSRRDSVGDLLEIGGIRTDRHQRNPIILFDHGKAIQLPIALAEDPQTKSYTVQLDPISRTAKANCFFYQGGGLSSLGDQDKASDHQLFCEQLFDLVVKKFVRAGSIGYTVTKSYPLPPDPETGINRGQHLLEVLMLEASIVVLPANGDTVRKALSLPQVCGKPLNGWLRKSLETYAPEKKAQLGYEPQLGTKPHQTRSWPATSKQASPNQTIAYQNVGPHKAVELSYNIKDGSSMKKLEKSVLTENSAKILEVLRTAEFPHGLNIGDMVVKTGVAAEDLRDAIEELLRSGEIRRNYHDWKITYAIAGDPSKSLRLQYRTKSGENMPKQPAQDKPPIEEVPGEATKKEMPDEPFGAQTLRQLHADHKLLMEDYARMHKLNDHPKVKKALEKKLGDIDKDMSQWESIWNTDYKDLPPLEGAMHGSDVDPEQGSEEADSREEELPPPEEAAEAEEESSDKGPKKAKSLPKQKTKEAQCGQYRRCAEPDESLRKKKGACPECGKENCGCKDMGVESGHVPGNERNDPEPGTEYHGENEEGHRPGQLQNHEKEMVGNAHHFLKELSAAPELQNNHRMDAWHHAKTLANISLAEAHDKVAHNLGNHDVPPATWEPGVGAKSQPSDTISPEKARQILKDGTVHGHKLSPKQEGLFGAAAGRDKKSMGMNEHLPMEEADQLEEVQTGPETEEMEDHRKMCGKASHFLQEVALGKDWSDTHREKSAYWHKTLGGMMGNPTEQAEANAAMHEMGSMKELKSLFDQQNQDIESLSKKLELIGVT